MDSRIAAILAKNNVPVPAMQASSGTAMDFVVNRVLAKKPEQASDISRICSIPISEPLTREELDAVSVLEVKPDAYAKGFRLTDGQAEAIWTFRRTHGLFAPLPVGAGKTLVSLRCVGIGIEEGLQRIALFVPPQVHTQLVNRDIAWTRQRVNLGCSFYPMGGKSREQRAALAGGRRGCWIFPYSLLSAQDASELLDKIRPELMIFDEAHYLKHRDAARTKRVLTYYRKQRPWVVALSGTMTSKSLLEFAHLLTMSLKENAPVPMEAQVVNEWAATIDSDQTTDAWRSQKTGTGPLRPLINWSRKHFPTIECDFDTQGFRLAFQNRLVTSPGVVQVAGGSIGTALYIENKRHDYAAATGGPQLFEHLKKLEDLWVSPDGDEIEHAMIVWKWQNELTSGIYNSLVWPTAEELEGVPDAHDRLERSKHHHKLRQDYHRELRGWFKSRPHKPGLDTPFLVASDMQRHQEDNVGRELYAAWRAMKDAEFVGMIQRRAVPVRVCDYKVKAAIEWMKKRTEPGIVWYYHQEMGRWIHEQATAAGIPCVHVPAGKASDTMLAKPEELQGKFLICSVTAHGTGKNLQWLCDQLFVQFPGNGEAGMEQAIGRTHRQGQTADEVTVHTVISNQIDEMALAAVLNDAIYVFETTGQNRKVLLANWNPLPTVYASEVLVRAGTQARRLNAKQQMLLEEKFKEKE